MSLVEGSPLFQSRDIEIVKHLPLRMIVPSKLQPRTFYDQKSLELLTTSIKVVGVLHPILVRPLSREVYEIVVGHRRFFAAQKAGLRTIPCIVRDLSDDQVARIQIIENSYREDLSKRDTESGIKRWKNLREIFSYRPKRKIEKDNLLREQLEL